MLSVMKKMERYFWDVLLIMFVFILFYYLVTYPPMIEANREMLIKFADNISLSVEKFGNNKAALGYLFFCSFGLSAISFWMLASIMRVSWKFVSDKEAEAGPIVKLFFWIKKRRTKEV